MICNQRCYARLKMNCETPHGHFVQRDSDVDANCFHVIAALASLCEGE